MLLYRWLLYLYPASFRAEYGDPMCEVFETRRASGENAAALWLTSLLDVLSNALRVHWDILRQDLRYTRRTIARTPGFAITAVVVAALGIGATTAAFSITDHVLLRPLPFPHAERLVKLWQRQLRYTRSELSPLNFRDWKQISTSFSDAAGFRGLEADLVGQGSPERLHGASVMTNLFPLLGIPPALGRGFTADDGRADAPNTAMLSYGLWQGLFGGDAGAIGRRIVLDGKPYTVIGVMPRTFYFPSRDSQIWTGMRWTDMDMADRTNTYIQAIGRLRPGVSVGQAAAEMRVIAGQLERQYPKENAGIGANVIPLRDELSDQSRLALEVLSGAALCLLLIACANLSNLLLARAIARRRELAVRTALGAGRERLMRQMLTESLVLATLGGILGVVLAMSAAPLLVKLAPDSLPIAEMPPMDFRVLGMALALTVATALGFGVLPTWRACTGSDTSGLREGARAGDGVRRERIRSALVVAEVTASVALLICAGLLIRALWRLQAVDPGFRPDGVLTMRTALPNPKYDATARRVEFYRAVLSEVRALPDVRNAAYISFLPMAMRGGIWPVEFPGVTPDPLHPNIVSVRFVTPGFFDAMAIPLKTGRDVSESDTEGRPNAAVVSESFAHKFWPGENPIGRHFQVAFRDRVVVGVAGNIRVRGLERTSEPQVYLSYQQVSDGAMPWYTPKDLVIRSSAGPGAVMPSVREIVRKADPELPISEVQTMRQIVDGQTTPRSVQVRVLGAFAAVALLLAGIGIHGLLSFAVSMRAQEIGVRMALGARRSDVLRMVLRQGFALCGAGVALGLALAYAGGQALRALLAGVSPEDTETFAAAIAVAFAMMLAGSLVPALRAVRVDPVRVMRME